MSFKTIGCGVPTAPIVQATDTRGKVWPLLITDTDEDYGVIDMTTESDDFYPGPDGSPFEFVINIQSDTAGQVICVQLSTGAFYIINDVELGAYLGQWYPAKIIRVLKTLWGTNTTGLFKVGA